MVPYPAAAAAAAPGRLEHKPPKSKIHPNERLAQCRRRCPIARFCPRILCPSEQKANGPAAAAAAAFCRSRIGRARARVFILPSHGRDRQKGQWENGFAHLTQEQCTIHDHASTVIRQITTARERAIRERHTHPRSEE